MNQDFLLRDFSLQMYKKNQTMDTHKILKDDEYNLSLGFNHVDYTVQLKYHLDWNGFGILSDDLEWLKQCFLAIRKHIENPENSLKVLEKDF